MSEAAAEGIVYGQDKEFEKAFEEEMTKEDAIQEDADFIENTKADHDENEKALETGRKF